MSTKKLNGLVGAYNKFHSDKQKKKIAMESKKEKEPVAEEQKEMASGDKEEDVASEKQAFLKKGKF